MKERVTGCEQVMKTAHTTINGRSPRAAKPSVIAMKCPNPRARKVSASQHLGAWREWRNRFLGS